MVRTTNTVAYNEQLNVLFTLTGYIIKSTEKFFLNQHNLNFRDEQLAKS